MCVQSSTQHSFEAQSSFHGGAPDCVPADDISAAAFRHAQASLPTAILNHSIRVFIYAKHIWSLDADANAKFPEQQVFCACILHDIGASGKHDGPQRFEVEGADAAAALLRSHKVSEDDIKEVWTAIALHTSPGIAERITPLSRLVRLAVLCDFGRPAARQLVSTEQIEMAEQDFPRLQIEKLLGDTVVEQALNQREKAPAASWPGILLRAKLDHPEWEGVNKAF